MSQRGLFLDVAPGERRGVVTLAGRPERLLVARDGASLGEALGARLVGRIRALDAAAGLAFVDLGEGREGVLNFTKESGRPVQGAALEVEIRTEARRGKLATLRAIGPADGPPRLLAPAPELEERLQAFAPGTDVRRGPSARAMADLAQDEAMASEFPLPGGGRIWIEPTHALTAVDVDLGGRTPAPPKKAARAANLEALAEAARALRLKGLGGLVVIDLVGRAHDPAALLAATRTAFAPDNPGVALGAVSRFGTLELTIPRRARPAVEELADERGASTPLTWALSLLRALEREGLADPGGRFAGVAPAPIVEAARPALGDLNGRMGGRLELRAELPRAGAPFEVVRA
jgi:Ribonuclease E/G family